MSYTVRLTRSGSTVYTFTTTPFVSPKHEPQYDSNEPPRIVGVKKTWTLEGILYGSTEANTITAYDALKGFFDGTLSQPDGIELVRSGSVVESITTSNSHSFRLVSLSSPVSDMQWRGEMRFTMVVESFKRVATSGTISRLEQTETWNYDTAGLLTRTLEGEVEVTTGSAEDAARELGYDIDDFGPDYGFVTRGPEGVDITVLGEDGLRAKFRSVVSESGQTLPANVSPFFSIVTETQVNEGLSTTITSISAEGTGAEAAVRARIPADHQGYVVRVDPYRRTASAVIRDIGTDPASVRSDILSRAFQVEESGASGITWSRRSGKRKPVKHTTSLGPTVVVEDLAIQIFGALPLPANLRFPGPLPGVSEDLSRWRMNGPNRLNGESQSGGERWAISIRRVYTVGGLDEIANAMIMAATAAEGLGEDSATLETEFTRLGVIAP